ncbi:MAG: molybdopterin-dependent oxidoreductase [Gammaproteobacteria bacterium]|nr:molybdopterin-dependent oxidoreductase [Gammaproteobacteria bacterium]
MTASHKLEVPPGHSLHHVVCPHDCPDTCSMLVTRDDSSGRAVAVQGDPTHPITRGYLCNKVNHYLDYVYNERRVLYPHRRVGPKGPGARFERISWDEALTTVTDNFRRIIAEHGSEAIQPFNFSGTLGQIGYWVMDNRFWNKLGAARLEMSICIHAAFWACMHTYGSANGPDLAMASEDAEVIILWGVNSVSTGVHAVPFLRAARERGCRIVVIDPRPTRTAWLADWHLQPRPGTDAALALGMMKVLVDRGLHDQDFLERHTRGWRELIETRLPEYPLERVAAITGLAVEDIERLALLYGGTQKSYIRAGHGLNRHHNSGQMCRAVLLLPALTGAWREACGGAGFGRLEENWNPFFRPDVQRDELGDRAAKRIVNMVQMGRALLHDIGWNEEPLDPPIKCLFVYNADPANCVPNVADMRRGLMRDDLFTVVHDTMWTDSCDYADIVLPADTQLERTDFHGSYGYYHYAMNRPVIAPLGESVSNAELFRRLAQSMGYVESSGDAFTQSDEDIIREHLLDGEKNVLVDGIRFEDLVENGWARANYAHPARQWLEVGWPTPDGRIQIWSDALAAEDQDPLPVHHVEMEGQEDPLRARFPLQVLSNASHYFVGDSFQTVERLQAMQSRPTFEINPDEAARRGIADGDLCRLYNDRGETFGHAVILAAMLPGVVGTQKQFKGSNTPGGINVNALNTEVLTDFGFAPSFYSCLAEIEKSDDATAARARAAAP